MRYTINISFKQYGTDNIVEKVKTLREAVMIVKSGIINGHDSL